MYIYTYVYRQSIIQNLNTVENLSSLLLPAGTTTTKL